MDATIEWREGRTVPVRLSGPPGAVGIALGHGAGGNQDSPVIAAVRDGLVRLGHRVVTFDYPYRTEGRKAPDRQAVLLECHRAVLEWARRQVGERLVIGGVSMGGRMASYLAAEGAPVDGLLLVAYPLHPAGRTDRLRSEHLSSIAVPTLFVVGDRDPLCSLEQLPGAVRPMARADVHLVEDADHSFRGRAGRSREDMLDEVVEAAGRWLAAI